MRKKQNNKKEIGWREDTKGKEENKDKKKRRRINRNQEKAADDGILEDKEKK